MKILLMGEYSRLHNSLKEGLAALGHDAVLVSNGDGFKSFPSDHSISAIWSESVLMNIPRKAILKITGIDIAKIERGIRFKRLLPKLTGYDIVQLINEAPIKTSAGFEFKLLQKLVSQNRKIFLLSCGADYLYVKFLLEMNPRKSLLKPYLENPSLKNHYEYIFDYTTDEHRKIHHFLYAKCEGIIASDMDYALPLAGNPKFSGLIPNPVNTDKLAYKMPVIEGKVKIFLGINQWTYHQKGIPYFEKALEKIQSGYADKVEVLIAKNIPYADYIKMYNDCHILLDQVHAYDQGYNALEAMAKGKVVFTGAETEFENYFGIKQKVAINAVPDVDYLVYELEKLINNPEDIALIGTRARAFIEQEHDYVKIARKYLETWQ